MEEPVEEVTTRAEGLWRANRAEDNAGARGDRYQPRGTGGAEEQGRADRNGGGGTNFLGWTNESFLLGENRGRGGASMVMVKEREQPLAAFQAMTKEWRTAPVSKTNDQGVVVTGLGSIIHGTTWLRTRNLRDHQLGSTGLRTSGRKHRGTHLEKCTMWARTKCSPRES